MKLNAEEAMRLKGHVAVVTGGAGGIGSGIVRKLVENGSAVVIGYIAVEAEKATALVDEITAAGGRAVAYEADVTNEEQVNGMIQCALDTYGDLTILVNCAGITKDATIRNVALETWNQVIAVNLTSQFLSMKAALTYMIPKKRGRIINISSLGALTGNPGACPYSASKAGILGLTKAVAKEVARKNITVNAVCPSVINTDMTKRTGKEAVESFLEATPIPRMGEPWEVGELCVYLASDAASFITGGVIKFDGGMGIG